MSRPPTWLILSHVHQGANPPFWPTGGNPVVSIKSRSSGAHNRRPPCGLRSNLDYQARRGRYCPLGLTEAPPFTVAGNRRYPEPCDSYTPRIKISPRTQIHAPFVESVAHLA
ncbi:hypothetical protein JCGZ_10842 [Jatropha curcas]|uniref:Uncharacterized protein n=1 Tax=Jatropha curcas TaxID=180498 RepID=A0A067KI48_JATCU|nr:hypothetical protein JCGZ_10842 [Jatropha curcas]